MAMAKKTESVEIKVPGINMSTVEIGILGTSPMIFNAVADKARRELLFPSGRKTTEADRAGVLKHEPHSEYKNSTYRHRLNDKPTRLHFPSTSFKKAMGTAALDLPGTKKAQIGRLSWVEGYTIDIYGKPELLMSVVRNSDPGHTPDIRTRAILSEWGTIIKVSFVQPRLQANSIANLLAAAGITVGVGDFRQEKGAGSFGQFRICDVNDPELRRIMKEGGRKVQDAALEKPGFFDLESEELFLWFYEEIERRKRDVRTPVAAKRGRKKNNGAEVEATL